MRIADFLILILQSHAQTLQRLAALFGEDEFTEMLENAEEPSTPGFDPEEFSDGSLRLIRPQAGDAGAAYQQLEGCVRELSLPEVLEFHLWAYPFYRAFIESSLDLNVRIPSAGVPRELGGETGSALVMEAIRQHHEWLKRLAIPERVRARAQAAAETPWLRFRSEALKRLGHRPLGPVYALAYWFLPFALSLSLTTAARALASTARPRPQSVELHAHLFMREGMGVLASGDFFGELTAQDYRSRFGSQANPTTLESSDVGLVVVTAYAHPLFKLSLRNSVRKQLELAERFAKENSDRWQIARSPKEATEAWKRGKRVIVLALEGADGILDSEEDRKEFIEERGIRIVTPLHLTDDQYGGVAFLDGIRGLSSPWAWMGALAQGSRSRPQAGTPLSDPSVLLNTNGLSPKGRSLTEALLRHRVWIDLSHASDASLRTLNAILRERGIPLLYTHAPLRRYLAAERGVSQEQLQELAASRGILGIMPSPDMLQERRLTCKDGKKTDFLKTFSLEYQESIEKLGPLHVALGSDTQGGIHHFPPPCEEYRDWWEPKRAEELFQKGFYNISMNADLWKALEKLTSKTPFGAQAAGEASDPVTAFIATWQTAWDHSAP